MTCYSGSFSSLPSVGLCFSGFFFFSITTLSGGGAPTRSRASSLTAVTARNGFLFFFLGISRCYAEAIVYRGPAAECAIICNMEERDFFDEKQEKKPASLNCPHCHQSAEYEVTWIVRTKKRQLPGRADERDRARFAKFRSYMVRKDDMMACKNIRCRKRFDISGQSTVLTE